MSLDFYSLGFESLDYEVDDQDLFSNEILLDDRDLQTIHSFQRCEEPFNNVNNDLLDYEEEEEEVTTTQEIDTTNDLQIKSEESKQTTKYQNSFRDLLLRPELLRAINDCGFENPSEVQNECIPQAIMGVDILCQAKSGMGKTCVFVLSTLQQIDDSSDHILVVVLVSTRELAFQISKEYERFAKYMRVNVALFIGGIPQQTDEELLRRKRPNIVVATTGRLRGFIRDRMIDLSRVKHFIIDEFDHILDRKERSNTLEDVLYINKYLPKNRQAMMFSATVTQELRVRAKTLMNNPLEVIIGDDSKLVLHGLQQFCVRITEKAKVKQLYDILTTTDYKQAIVFVQRINRCKALCELLYNLGVSVLPIHSDLTQTVRLDNYQMFRNYRKRTLITTAMFDRGVDFERVNLVINYDMPETSDLYLHAVGRAGRFGTKGAAVSFISDDYSQRIQNEIRIRFGIKFEEMPLKIVI